MLPQSLGFYNSNNVLVSGLSSLNSQIFHIILDGCKNTRLEGVKISAPENSPNTDGIHVQSSSGVAITNSHIGTGDDCISLGPGSSNMWIENINCGPGHGIRYQNRKLSCCNFDLFSQYIDFVLVSVLAVWEVICKNQELKM